MLFECVNRVRTNIMCRQAIPVNKDIFSTFRAAWVAIVGATVIYGFPEPECVLLKLRSLINQHTTRR